MEIKEFWKDIPDFSNYQASNKGKIRNKRNKKILKNNKRKDGYEVICLVVNNIHKMCYVHRIIAKTFIDNPNKLSFINHKDENKSNNNIDNLEWCTQKYNNNFGTRGKRISKALNLKIIQCDLNENFIKNWESIKEATDTLKIRNISQVVNGKRKQAGGYIWKKSKV